MIEIVGIRFKKVGKIYYFAPGNIKANVGDKAIVETVRGVECGEVVIANRMIEKSSITSELKEVIRLATPEDLEIVKKNQKKQKDAFEICQQKIKNRGLDMNLIDVEFTFDNNKILFYFTAETRVDFRELVKDLASTFKTRIELRQIGIRDEAKMMGGLGVCGRKYCCSGFLSDFVQVSIKMAKEQNFSLNSAKVSGACGRLMCCLRYEHETYEEAIKETPPVGSTVETKDGVGHVIETKPLAKEIRVRLSDKEKETTKLYAIADVKVLARPNRMQSKSNDQDGDEEEE